MSDNPLDNDHVGENPVTWPNQRIAAHPDMWEADELATDIAECRRCSHKHGVCRRHQAMIEGYNKAVSDMTRAFDITEDDYPDELLGAADAE